MPQTNFDCIVAPITGHPPAGVAWIRLSGEGAWRIAKNAFPSIPASPRPRHAYYGHWAHGDDGLALLFPAGHSYTGEEAAELSMHGSIASIDAAVGTCEQLGARRAEPGEFTQRAFLNGRIDLTQAEAIRDGIEALTEAQLRLSNANREGALRRLIERMRHDVERMLAEVEASVDFSEEIGDFNRDAADPRVTRLLADVESLLATSSYGRIVRNGYRIGIAGRPNAGKSSLLNRILKTERAIVSETPGTTRDYIEESINLDGVLVVLLDTAGLRNSTDAVEMQGIARARELFSTVDAIWYLYDARQGWTEEDSKAVAALPVAPRILANKVDAAEAGTGMPVSAATGTGIDDLLRQTREEVLRHAQPTAVNSRHAAHLGEARETLIRLREALPFESEDLLSVLLRDLHSELGKVTGQTAQADMIDAIFRNFCVGK